MMSTREKHPKIHRIALVDNDPRALDSLSAVIASKVPTAYVVWTATSGCEAIERCQDANGHVSLLILDMSMEGLQGPATCRRLRLMGQRMPILGATSFSINSYRDKLVEAGAQGLVGKENADQLAQIIMRMCNGEVMEGFEPPALANLRISREAETTPALTVREEQIISLCAEGMLDRDIAERLGISEATIRKHMQNFKKTQLQDLASGSGTVGEVQCALNPQLSTLRGATVCARSIRTCGIQSVSPLC